MRDNKVNITEDDLEEFDDICEYYGLDAYNKHNADDDLEELDFNKE